MKNKKLPPKVVSKAATLGVNLAMTLATTLGLTASFLTTAPNAIAADDSVRVCIEGANPPYSSISPSGEIIGFDVDIGRAIVEKMGKKYTMVKMDWDGIIPALLAKKCDAIISSMSITDERKKKIDFTDKYYGNPPLRFVAKKGRFANDAPATLKGITVGVQQATIAVDYLKQIYPDIKLRAYALQDEANADLLAGRVDAIFQDSVPLAEFLKTKQAAGLGVFGKDHNDPKILGIGAGIGLRKGDTALRDGLNKAIKGIRADGAYKKINDKYFNFDIYK
ncbi:MAG: transporter substrate-binding domain-containing protein [Hydrotalea sp.]|nr:transporter substrate-binding domain-containing protein [Hydrotalea sp.]